MEDGKPTRAGWESSRAAPLAPRIESVAIKTREGGKEMFKKPPWGFRAAIRVPRRGILERCELGSPECAAKEERNPGDRHGSKREGERRGEKRATTSTAEIQRQSRRQNLDWISFSWAEGKKRNVPMLSFP
ncbi:Chromodomain-Helicase-Dna-Binding Protein 3 [Manis pentadactyla]|nr:Chromodomain-Helicase-Dna-Binding Protein 3 [Manis pentadactyla]